MDFAFSRFLKVHRGYENFVYAWEGGEDHEDGGGAGGWPSGQRIIGKIWTKEMLPESSAAVSINSLD